MNLFTDKDKPIFLAILISIFSWTFNNYVDSLRLDATLYASKVTAVGEQCRTDTFTFANLSSKNGIANLQIAITADTQHTQVLKLCGQETSRTHCFAIEPHRNVAEPQVVSLPVTFPMIYPEHFCSIEVSVEKTFPALTFVLLEPSDDNTAKTDTDKSVHLVSDKMRIVTEYSLEIFVIRNVRFIYFCIMTAVLLFMVIWFGLAIVKTQGQTPRTPPAAS